MSCSSTCLLECGGQRFLHISGDSSMLGILHAELAFALHHTKAAAYMQVMTNAVTWTKQMSPQSWGNEPRVYSDV